MPHATTTSMPIVTVSETSVQGGAPKLRLAFSGGDCPVAASALRAGGANATAISGTLCRATPLLISNEKCNKKVYIPDPWYWSG